MKKEKIEEKLKEIIKETVIRKNGRRYYHSQCYSHIVWNLYHPEDQKTKFDGYHIHHIDRNKLNDNIENLQKLRSEDHLRLLKHTEESKKKMSSANLGNKYCVGRKYSAESKNKMRLSNIGKKRSKEVRKRMSESKKGNKSMLGKKHSEETKKKMSLSKIGHFVSEESKRKSSESQKGRIVSEETRKKMSVAAKKRHLKNKNMMDA